MRSLVAFIAGFLILTPSALAQEQSFSDVSSSHYSYPAVEFLKANGFISGYDDGTFKPENNVNRAEAMKMIIAPLVGAEALAQYAESPFSDVEAGAWFLPYVEYGRAKNIIDGPPTKPAFLGVNPVIKVEFIKMLLLAHELDPNAYNEIKLPLADDVTNPDEWYYKYLRFAISASMTMISSNGTLDPARQLTRGETAVLIHRLLMYKEGRRTQALLSEAESEILIILGALEKNNIEQAEYASARALIAARGAHASQPETPVVVAALKITEAFRALVRAYRAGVTAELESVVSLSSDAWHLAAKASEVDPGMTDLAAQVQNIASGMANSARELIQAGE